MKLVLLYWNEFPWVNSTISQQLQRTVLHALHHTLETNTVVQTFCLCLSFLTTVVIFAYFCYNFTFDPPEQFTITETNGTMRHITYKRNQMLSHSNIYSSVYNHGACQHVYLHDRKEGLSHSTRGFCRLSTHGVGDNAEVSDVQWPFSHRVETVELNSCGVRY